MLSVQKLVKTKKNKKKRKGLRRKLSAFLVQMKMGIILYNEKSLHHKLEELWFRSIKWCHFKWCHPKMVAPGRTAPLSNATGDSEE